jgi:hypothetical protein
MSRGASRGEGVCFAYLLVDEVIPRVPVRQWVLSLPFELRYRLAWDHDLCRAVLRIYTRAGVNLGVLKERRASRLRTLSETKC